MSEVLTSLPGKAQPRLALVGIGNELNADDAAGILALRELAARLPFPLPPHLLLVEAGPAPENFTAPLRRFHPDVVLLLDAVQMGASPGRITWLDWNEAEGFSASTHTLPPTLFGQFLTRELGCRVLLVGIQVGSIEFDQPPDPAVKRAAARLSGRLEKLIEEIY